MQLSTQMEGDAVQLPCSQLDFDPFDLLSIFEPQQQVSVIAKPVQAQISGYLQQTGEQLSTGYRLMLRQTEATPDRLDREMRLPDGIGKDALLTDICRLVNVYADLMDCPTVGIRLEVLSHAMCPRFHIDRTGIRLLCTYLGPGTEWLDEAFCNRSAMTGRYATTDAFHRTLVLHPQGIHQAPAHALVLLKGSLWQGNQHAGAIHRSPDMAASSKRIVLALDAIW